MRCLQNEDDDDVPPIGDGTSVRPPVDNEWPMPGGEGRPTRPPPTWGPPDAPSGGDGDVGGDEEPEEPEPEPTRPTPKPGGIGYVEKKKNKINRKVLLAH